VWKLWAAGTVSVVAMLRSRIDISQGLDGEPVVLACLDLAEEEIAASAHAVAATATERFRTASMSVDEVLEFRELTALADELADLARRPGMRTVVLRPAAVGLSRRRRPVRRDARRRRVDPRGGPRAARAPSRPARLARGALRRGAARRAVAADRAAPPLTPPAALVSKAPGVCRARRSRHS
jgi:hypothetical protein